MPFLPQVARHLIDSGIDLSTTTLIFPNRRSALFMRRHLQRCMTSPSFMPRFVSLDRFVHSLYPTGHTDDAELVMLLYKAYCNVLRRHQRQEQIPEFDAFCFWGKIVLNDFNDIDAYLADPSQLYRNLKSIREISANYLTPEQNEVIALLWGQQAVNSSSTDDDDNFWRHMPSQPGDDSPSGHFIALWQIMAELYNEYVDMLDNRAVPLAYSGLKQRRAAERVKGMAADEFPRRHYAFIGFYKVTSAQALIMKRLKNLGIASFYWDDASPLLRGTTAGRVISELVSAFPMPDDFALQSLTHKPEIELVGSPSAIGQVKIMSQVISDYSKHWLDHKQRVDPAAMLATAVLLPDDSLLLPALHSIPPSVDKVNVTMGITFGSTPFAALLAAITSMHIRSYLVHGTIHYFYKDVVEVLSHSHMSMVAGEQAAALLDEISDQRLYNVEASYIISRYPDLAFVFQPISNQRDIVEVSAYITNLINTLTTRLGSNIKSKPTRYYELRILQGYTLAIERLCHLANEHGISMLERTFLQMLERTLAQQRIGFKGEPLEGMQVMGVNDTRTLEFDSLVMLSMNERIFPRRNYTASLIPASLRQAYGLPNHEHEEAAQHYNFCRLVSRAKRVCLIYDNRTAALKSGEMSRFLLQLKHLHPELNIREHILEFPALITDPEPIVIDKSPEVVAELRRFHAGGDRRLSASALKSYIICPVKFYLQYVKGLRVNNPQIEYVDAASYGTALHSTAEELYRPYLNKLVTPADIKAMIDAENTRGYIELIARKALNHSYYRDRYTDRLDRMPAEGRILSKVIARYLVEMLECELKQPPFVFRGAEVGEHETFVWKIDDRYSLNFTMSIDRIDSVGADPEGDHYLRFIDYKTGDDDISVGNIEGMFTNHDKGALFQVLLYCHAFARNGDNRPIQPVIYKFQKMHTDGIKSISVSRKEINDYHQAAPEQFYALFVDMIHKIFEEEGEYPFTQTDKTDNCLYCDFKQFCNRFPEKKSI